MVMTNTRETLKTKGTSLFTQNKSFAGLSLPTKKRHYGPTDGPPDRPTDGRTDTPSYKDARTHLKKTEHDF